MDVGIWLDLRNPPQWQRPWPDHYRRNLELVEGAERLGAETVWLSEHHFFEDGYLPQPLTFAAALAARTARIRIGTAVYLAGLRRSVQAAEEAAIVDVLSGGRLDLGIGVGYRVPEFEAFGADISRRFATVERTIREMTRLWDGVVTPPPVQHPIPLWGGFYRTRGAKLAGSLGMGLLSLDRAVVATYQQALTDAGYAASDARVKAALQMVIVDDPDQAWARIRPHFAYQMDTYRRHRVEGTESAPLPTFDPDRARAGEDGAAPFHVVTPADAVGLIKRSTEGLPVREIFCFASIAAMPEDLVQRHVELLCTVVRPAIAAF